MYKEKDKDDSSKSILLTAKNSFLNARPQTKLISIIEKAKTLRRTSYDSPGGRAHFNLKKSRSSDINSKRSYRSRSSIHFSFLEKKSPKELFFLLLLNEKKLLYIDIILFIADLLIVILMYFNITFQIDDTHSLSFNNNVLRIIYICISLGLIGIVVYRHNVKSTYKMIEYLLKITPKHPRYRKKKMFFIFEVCIHCVNLIPFYSHMVCFRFNGVKNYFCLDIAICLIGTLRLYSIFRLYQSYIQFYHGKLNRMVQNFEIYSFLLFYIKKGIISRPCVTLILLFWIICFNSMLLFVLIECHFARETNRICKEFSISNIFWFTTNIQFQRDYFPQTLTGRSAFALLMIPGMFYSVVFPSICYFFSVLRDDKEKKTYRLIQSLYSKGMKESMTYSYYNDYIKNKFTKIKMRNKSVMAYLFASEEQERNRERYYLQIRSLLRIPFTLIDFCEILNKTWSMFSKEVKSDLNETIDIYHDFIYFALTTIDELHESTIELYKLSTQNVNLCYMMILFGGKFEVKDFTYMKGYKIITMKNYIEKCREFEVKRCDLTRKSLQYTIDSSGELNMPFNLKIYDREMEDIRDFNNLGDSDESDSFITEDDSIFQSECPSKRSLGNN